MPQYYEFLTIFRTRLVTQLFPMQQATLLSDCTMQAGCQIVRLGLLVDGCSILHPAFSSFSK
jgi:hypothetical protein